MLRMDGELVGWHFLRANLWMCPTINRARACPDDLFWLWSRKRVVEGYFEAKADWGAWRERREWGGLLAPLVSLVHCHIVMLGAVDTERHLPAMPHAAGKIGDFMHGGKG